LSNLLAQQIPATPTLRQAAEAPPYFETNSGAIKGVPA
jgi:hypothetical protein